MTNDCSNSKSWLNSSRAACPHHTRNRWTLTYYQLQWKRLFEWRSCVVSRFGKKKGFVFWCCDWRVTPECMLVLKGAVGHLLSFSPLNRWSWRQHIRHQNGALKLKIRVGTGWSKLEIPSVVLLLTICISIVTQNPKQFALIHGKKPMN